MEIKQPHPAWLQRIPIRKVAAIIERLCITQVSATQGRRAAEQLDETLGVWRTQLRWDWTENWLKKR